MNKVDDFIPNISDSTVDSSALSWLARQFYQMKGVDSITLEYIHVLCHMQK